MNENIEHMKKIIGTKTETQRKLVEKEEKFDEYIQGLIDGRDGQKETIARNADDLDRMTTILDRALAAEIEQEKIRVEMARMVAADVWVFGDPESEKLENIPKYRGLSERFLQISRDLTADRTEVNKIYYRR